MDTDTISHQALSIVKLLTRMLELDTLMAQKQHELTSLMQERNEIVNSLDPSILNSIRACAARQVREEATE